jgi:single-strand DNA-binding protein
MITVTAVGRLTGEPVLRTTPNGKPVCEFRIAADRAGVKDAVDYLNVVVWRGSEANAKHLSKGRQVALTGRLEYESWETEDGAKHSRHRMNASEVTWLAKPKVAAEDQAA